MKKVLLVGFGSEIGSMLLSLNEPKKTNFKITTVITNKINNDNIKSLDSLYARLLINEPSLIGKIQINYPKKIIQIRNNKIQIIFGDILSYNFNNFKEKFDASIVATSKEHIKDLSFMKKLKGISKSVFGVAESLNIPAIYPCLTNFNDKFFINKLTPFKNNKIFALGSCQSNGWMSHLRCVNEFAVKYCKEFNYLNFEMDIVHPDTPTGKIGTKSINPRDQDARNNFRPGFSQVSISSKRLFPNVLSTHTVSLRTLIPPPGYLISRFLFNYKKKGGGDLRFDELQKFIENFSKKNKDIVCSTRIPLGSKAFEMLNTASVILSSKEYLIFHDNLLQNNKQNKISQIIIQSMSTILEAIVIVLFKQLQIF